MHKPEVELTKLDPSDTDTKITKEPFDPQKTVLPVKELKDDALHPECYRIHNDDWVGHGWNTEPERGGGPWVRHYNMKTQKYIARYDVPDFFDDHWLSSCSHMFNFKFEKENKEGDQEEESKQIQKQKDFSAIFAMNKFGKLFMLPKVEEEHDEVQDVKPIRILEDEFCDAKEGDRDELTPYIAAFELFENKIYMVSFNQSRKNIRVYRIGVQSSTEFVVEQRTEFSHKMDMDDSFVRIALIDGYLYFMKHTQNLVKCKCSDFEANQETVIDDDNRTSRWHDFKLWHDKGLNMVVVQMNDYFHFVNPATLSIVSKTKVHSRSYNTFVQNGYIFVSGGVMRVFNRDGQQLLMLDQECRLMTPQWHNIKNRIPVHAQEHRKQVIYDLDPPEKLAKEIIPYDSWKSLYSSRHLDPDTNTFYSCIDKRKILETKLTPDFKLESNNEIKVEIQENEEVEWIQHNKDYFAIYVNVQDEKLSREQQKKLIQVFKKGDNKKVLQADINKELRDWLINSKNVLIAKYNDDELHVYDLDKQSLQNPTPPKKILSKDIHVDFQGFDEYQIFKFDEDLNKLYFSEKANRGKIWNYDFNTDQAEMFPIDLKFSSDDISFTRDKKFAVIVGDAPHSILVLNLITKRIKSRYLYTEEMIEKYECPTRCHVVDHPDHEDHKFIVAVNNNFSVIIFSFEDLKPLYIIPRDPIQDEKDERAFRGFVQGVVFNPDWKHTNHIILWGFHLDVYDLHDGLDGRNIFWQSIKSMLEDKVDFQTVHLDKISSVFVDLLQMRGIHNLIADKIKDEDQHGILNLMVQRKMLMNDNESHLLTKLKANTKLGARDKLGTALLEAELPMRIQFWEFYEMMKDRNEWMVGLQMNNWTETEIEKKYAGEDINLFGSIRSMFGFLLLEGDLLVVDRDSLDQAIKFEEQMKEEMNKSMISQLQNKGGHYKKLIACLEWCGLVDTNQDINVQQISMVTSPVKLNLTLGSDENIKMLTFFQSKSINGQQIYDGPNFFLIEKQWYDYLPAISAFVIITRVLPAIWLTLFLLNPGVSFLFWLCLVTAISLLINELNQLRHNGVREYIGEFMNMMDFIGNTCGIIYLLKYKELCMGAPTDADELKEFDAQCLELPTQFDGYIVYAQILWTLSIAIRSSELFKLKKTFRELYVILRVSVQDCAAFIAIFVYMIFAVTIISKTRYLLDSNFKDKYEWNFFSQMGDWFAITAGGMGDPPSAGLYEQGPTYVIHSGEWVIFIFAMFAINILILNTLIAILGDSYDKVVMDKQMYETQEKLPILIEFNLLISFFRSNAGERKYLHLVRYESGGGGGGDDEWMGKIRYLQNIVKNSNKQSESEFQDKLNNVKRELINQLGDEIEQNCIKIKSGVDKKLDKQTNDILAQVREIVENQK